MLENETIQITLKEKYQLLKLINREINRNIRIPEKFNYCVELNWIRKNLENIFTDCN